MARSRWKRAHAAARSARARDAPWCSPWATTTAQTCWASPGEDLPHVSHFYAEAHPYYRQRVVIVGGKNSACEAALELHRAGAHVTLVHRGATLSDSVKYWVRPDVENRIREASIAARFSTEVVEIRATEVIVRERGTETTGALAADSVLLLTGYQADAASSGARVSKSIPTR